jgi:hypothetical protein
MLINSFVIFYNSHRILLSSYREELCSSLVTLPEGRPTRRSEATIVRIHPRRDFDFAEPISKSSLHVVIYEAMNTYFLHHYICLGPYDKFDIYFLLRL